MRTSWTIARGLAASCATTCILIVLFESSPPGGLSSLAASQNLAPPQRQNQTPIILISVDTLRADHLSCYGFKGPPTTNIDRFAAGGTIFLEANSQVPLTLPSHVSMLTSTYPFANGVEDNGEQLAPRAVTLARVLKSQGYRTAGFIGGFVLDRRFGLDQGFDVYDGPSKLGQQLGRDPGDIKRFGEEVTHAASNWLEQNSDYPFFLFLHLYDLHTPYRLPPSELQRNLSYDGELGYVDKVLGTFWEVLQRRGLLDRALVVFTADHGESLREHGESTHGYFVYQSTLRVPLIIRWPKQSSFPARVDKPVSLLDVAPTVLQILGFSRPAEFQGRNLLGPISRPASGAAKGSAPEEIYSESLYPHAHFGTSALRTLRVGSYKYIQAPRPEFYDLVRDPAEKQNLYESQKSLALSFRHRIESLRARYRAEHASASRAQRPDAIEQLRSLGYLAGSDAPASGSDSGVDPKDRIVEYEKYGRALTLASAGQLSASNASLEQLLDKDPNLLDVRAALGLNQQKLGRHAESAENFKAVLKQNPLSAVAHFNLAVSENSLGRQEVAVKELEATLALAPNYVRAEEMLAGLYLEKKNYEGARTHLNHLIEADPGNYTANYNLGALDCLQGNWRDGDRHLRAAIQADPTSAEAHNMLGSLHLRRADVDAARAEFVEAIRLNPKFAPAHYNLGIVFRQQHQNEEAAQEFHKALSSDPQFRQAREALDRLKQAAGQNK
jgi:choline-sulfatase